MKRFAICACALLVGACANQATTSTDAPAPEKEYRTGSNIPQRKQEGVVQMSPEEMERIRQQSVGNTGKPRGN